MPHKASSRNENLQRLDAETGLHRARIRNGALGPLSTSHAPPLVAGRGGPRYPPQNPNGFTSLMQPRTPRSEWWRGPLRQSRELPVLLFEVIRGQRGDGRSPGRQWRRRANRRRRKAQHNSHRRARGRQQPGVWIMNLIVVPVNARVVH